MPSFVIENGSVVSELVVNRQNIIVTPLTYTLHSTVTSILLLAIT